MTAAERQGPQAGEPGIPDWMDGVLRLAMKAGAHLRDVRVQPLAGGVSSDIYRVDAGGLTFCVKRALPKLKVVADWRAPVERSHYEVAWMRTAAAIVPDAVPEVLGEDAGAGAFAMAWLAPDRYPVWKARLLDGVIDVADGCRVGEVLGRIHAATADRADLAREFATDALFEALRIEPYLLATARAHPDLGERLRALADTTRTTRRVLVHGDFSPKNLLIGPSSPIVLDAECAWFGDPAFDLAFVLNHLLLKGAWRPAWRGRYLGVFTELVASYRPHVAWEDWTELERRTAALLGGLLLARVDGKSPVEYLDEAGREPVRAFARRVVSHPRPTLAAIANEWSAQ